MSKLHGLYLGTSLKLPGPVSPAPGQSASGMITGTQGQPVGHPFRFVDISSERPSLSLDSHSHSGHESSCDDRASQLNNPSPNQARTGRSRSILLTYASRMQVLRVVVRDSRRGHGARPGPGRCRTSRLRNQAWALLNLRFCLRLRLRVLVEIRVLSLTQSRRAFPSPLASLRRRLAPGRARNFLGSLTGTCPSRFLCIYQLFLFLSIVWKFFIIRRPNPTGNC